MSKPALAFTDQAPPEAQDAEDFSELQIIQGQLRRLSSAPSKRPSIQGVL